MTREAEIVTYLRADDALGDILTGGIYSFSDLGEEGVTDPTTTPDAYASGKMLPNAVVKEAAEIPTGQLVDFVDQLMDSNQRVEIWIYARFDEVAAIEAAKSRIYTLMMGHRFSRGWPAVYVGPPFGILPAPTLARARLGRSDWQIHGMMRPGA